MVNKLKSYASYSKIINDESDNYYHEGKVYTYDENKPIQIVTDFHEDLKAKKWEYTNSTFCIARMEYEEFLKGLVAKEKENATSIVENNQFVYTYCNGTKEYRSLEWDKTHSKTLKDILDRFNSFEDIISKNIVFEYEMTPKDIEEYVTLKKGIMFCNLKTGKVIFKNSYKFDTNNVLIKMHPNYIKTTGCTKFTITLSKYNGYSYLCNFHLEYKKITTDYYGVTLMQLTMLEK